MRVLTAQPPDDSGADAFRRYRYQAHVAFTFALNCYLRQGVLRVVLEHFEDIYVELEDQHRFVAIKTRNPELGPWRFRHLLESNGALRSVLRTHRALGSFDDGRRIVYEIRLEGALDRDDEIRHLSRDGSGPTLTMLDGCVQKLSCTAAEARGMLERVLVAAPGPPRELIEDHNLGVLRHGAGHLPANDLKAAYDGTIDLICRAMAAELLGESWQTIALDEVPPDI